ncbi:hypothetical protein [Rhizobium oryziradicis]|uniref:Uncharacterized protein n=1 Tax=Rhizobium oryziradicis TaxID=1867956 RepID=A0A1Q8ZSI0_9HYPH|nr:hypothetical protein [Rhizobium oryziradicis]OLP45035.1 hypothetical protein BJF95_16855 [Rhizobium oryziradicis]
MAESQQDRSSEDKKVSQESVWRVPMLPPVEQRDAVREEWLRRLHWKDIDASVADDGGISSLWGMRSRDEANSMPWSPVIPPSQGNLGPLLGKPAQKGATSIMLSQQGHADHLFVTTDNEAKQTAKEGEQRPPNQTIKTEQSGSATQAPKEEEKSPWKFGSEAEFKRETNQESVKFGGDSGKTLRQAAGESLGESAKKFEKKYPKLDEIGVSGEYTAWDKSGEVKKIEGKNGFADGNLRVFYGDTKGSAKGTISAGGAKGEASAGAEIGMLKGEGNLGDKKSLLAGKAEGRAVAADAKAKVAGEIKFKEVEATVSGSLGASAVLLDGEVGGEIRITPRRIWNGVIVSGVNTGASWLGYGKQLENIDGWDWGIMLGGSVGGTVGLAAEAEASAGISKRDRKAGVETKIKLAPGLGGSVKGKAGLVW